MSEPLVGWGSRLIAFVLSPFLFPQSRVVLSHLPILPEAETDWTGSTAPGYHEWAERSVDYWLDSMA